MRVRHRRLEWWLRNPDGVIMLLLHQRHRDGKGVLLLMGVGRKAIAAAMTDVNGALENTSKTGHNMRADR